MEPPPYIAYYEASAPRDDNSDKKPSDIVPALPARPCSSYPSIRVERPITNYSLPSAKVHRGRPSAIFELHAFNTRRVGAARNFRLGFDL
jgi:hypothetical protein